MSKLVTASIVAAVSVMAAAAYLDHRTGLESAPAAPAPGPQTVSASPAMIAISADAAGHFTVAALINGVHVDMLADTGATAVVLTEDDALRAGIMTARLDHNIAVQTANGIAQAAQVTLDEVAVGQVSVRDVRALVVKAGLARSLLGMSFIGALSRFELKGDQLVLVQ